jgi:hypothetical protein
MTRTAPREVVDTAPPVLSRGEVPTPPVPLQQPPRRARSRHWGAVLPWVLPVAAVVIALAFVRGDGLGRLTDLGLVVVLPVGYFVALGLIAASFALALRGRERPTLLTFNVVTAIVLLFGVTLPYEQVPRFNIVYRHAGIIDHLLTGGRPDGGIDAYFNWPGFFMLGKFITQVAGEHSILPFASYAPLFFNLVMLPALIVIAKTAAVDWRTAWIGVWLFFLCNWIGQDYFSTQAYALVLYLTIAVALLTALAGRSEIPRRWWRRTVVAGFHAVGRRIGAPPDPVEAPHPPTSPLERAGTVLICVTMIAAMVMSHQLTPFATLLMMGTLVLTQRTTARLLPLITAALLTAWLAFMAVGYLSGHLREVLAEALSLEATVSANLGQRVTGSEGHLLIVYLRLGVTGTLWLLAAVGIVRMLLRGRSAPSHALLAFAPLLLVLLQPYGGEVLLRAYLFGLPFISVLVAWALFPQLQASWDWRRVTHLLLVSCVLMGTFLFTRYGNDRAMLYTSHERAAVTYLYEVAAPGDILAAGNTALPWEDRGYAEFDFAPLTRLVPPPTVPESPDQLAARVSHTLAAADGPGHAYLVVTRSQLAYEEMIGSSPWGSLRDLDEAAQRSPDFHVVYSNADARVYDVVEGP